MKHKNSSKKEIFTLPIVFDKFEKQYNLLKDKLGLKSEVNLFSSAQEKDKKTE